MNGKAHRFIGGATGFAYSVHLHQEKLKEDPEAEFDIGSAILYIGLGILGGSLPDLLEPATSPNHRGFFHSLAFGAAVMAFVYGEHSEEWDPELRKLARAFAKSYLSHLAADLTTPKGLPLLHPRIA
ncbi:metal-dependent hydrolase [Pelagicoccus sp. SDUM812002]|uniref:metal-dependent hydrolase n=1 Tax=Pelagicoccus sp. SDUM812002 TaxID=3041266 RepID=UPI00280FFEBB|nr:metal-dependent hydrolase [Pelagicoccus sp. SDUM812002]MDQ8184257.1 metal-dependent hydrolase [Pelagicoccus sp. SDUM812002]